MYVRLPNLIQGQGQLTRKLVFQPASLSSNLHKQMRAASEKLHVRTQRVRPAGGWPAGPGVGLGLGAAQPLAGMQLRPCMPDVSASDASKGAQVCVLC